MDNKVVLTTFSIAVERNCPCGKEEAKIGSIEQKYDLLTQHEKEVVTLIAQGLMNKVIAINWEFARELPKHSVE